MTEATYRTTRGREPWLSVELPMPSVSGMNSGIRNRLKVEGAKPYDLEERLLEFAARVIRLVEEMERSPAGTHVAAQFLRAGTSALPNHAEAQAAESQRDFVHKLKISLKELRETHRWLLLIHRVPLVKNPDRIIPLLHETDELIRIFVASIQTAQKKLNS